MVLQHLITSQQPLAVPHHLSAEPEEVVIILQLIQMLSLIAALVVAQGRELMVVTVDLVAVLADM
jgi:hypothetical protein